MWYLDGIRDGFRQGRRSPSHVKYGYQIDDRQYCKIAAAQFGYAADPDEYGGDIDCALRMAAKYISHQIINHPSKVKSVCESGDRFFILSLCTNLGQCEDEKRLAEAEEKLREYLRITEKGKWYLGANQWRWTRNRRVSRSSLKKFHPGFRPGTVHFGFIALS
ncbi:hypothetical protein SCP_0606550 [Sparassis crispa]|uniref:Uncharacterized protein n=1 Tax=Sparassis crispa TaxID=139825 RepID=A0A401GR36_9APHY|nr:hypothetical protein SCP_0606550 [Sparassis crispa]GBE84676.1 hypothetical protein SCP_0606550 [Sparassis crispa]